MSDATRRLLPPTTQPLAMWNPTRGIWETSQFDLFGRPAPYSATWWTSGMTRNGSVFPLPRSAHRIPGSVSSSSHTALFRTPLASDSARGGENLQQVSARRGTIALSHQIIDLALRGPDGYPKDEESLWALVRELFDAGDATPMPSRWEHLTGRPAPAPARLSVKAGPRPAPRFVEWLMGLPEGWVTAPEYGLTDAQQLTALGNGVLPAQATAALRALMSVETHGRAE